MSNGHIKDYNLLVLFVCSFKNENIDVNRTKMTANRFEWTLCYNVSASAIHI